MNGFREGGRRAGARAGSFCAAVRSRRTGIKKQGRVLNPPDGDGRCLDMMRGLPGLRERWDLRGCPAGKKGQRIIGRMRLNEEGGFVPLQGFMHGCFLGVLTQLTQGLPARSSVKTTQCLPARSALKMIHWIIFRACLTHWPVFRALLTQGPRSPAAPWGCASSFRR